jgi:WD40 repeat protein
LHPSIEAILSGEPEALLHAASCATCNSVAALAAPASAPRAVHDDLAELPVVDRALYTDLRGLDRGGMGLTWSARDRRLGRRVVLKELRDDLGDHAALARRLEQEARLTARLQHPSIVGVYEAGRWSNGEPFYAMPLVRGQPLDAILAVTREHRRLLPHVIAACEAVAYAHGEGIIHRDLKPANLMIGEYGETVVIDWGLAKAIGARDEPGPERADSLTRTGVGTPHYMPPEQARGEEPTPAADVYALGATLYHVLAGAPPYSSGDSREVRRRVIDGPPAPLRSVAPAAPSELVAVVEKAMARDPAARFATARELAAELERFLTGQLTRTHQYTLAELVRKFVRRHRTGVATVALAMLALGVGSVVAARRIARERDLATASERATALALADSEAARASLLAETPSSRLDALELALDASDRAPQGLFDVVAAGPALVSLGPTVAGAWFAPDGGRFATTDGKHTIAIRDARTGDVIRELPSSLAHAYWLAWSPDGRALVATGLETIVERWDLDGGRASRLAMPAPTELARFLPDGSLVAMASDGTARAWRGDVLAGEIALGCTPRDAAVARAIWIGCSEGTVVQWDGVHASRWQQPEPVSAVAADDRGTYTGSTAGTVFAWSSDGAPHAIWRDPGHVIYAVAAVPDALLIQSGRAVIAGRDGGAAQEEAVEVKQRPALGSPRIVGANPAAIVVLDAARREVVLRLRGHRSYAHAAAAASFDGTRIVSTTSAGEAALWDASFGATAGVLPDHDGEVVAIAVAGDRVRTLAVGGRVHEVSLGDGSLTLSEATAAVASSASDGGAVIAGGADGIARVWRGGAMQTLAVGSAPVTAVAISGTRIAAGDADGSIVLDDGSRVARAGDPVIAVAIVRGGVASAHRSGAVYLWPGGRRLGGDGAVTALAASPDGSRLAVGRDDRGELVDLASGDSEPLPGRPLAWSAAGTLALVDESGTLWKLRDGVLHRIAGELPAITAATFSGETLWTGDVTGEVHGWLATGGSLSLPARDAGAVTALAPAGAWVVAGHASGAVRVLPATLSSARARACATLVAFGRASASCR